MILFGDCRQSLQQMIAEGRKAQMCVTSPPYLGLRDYGTGQWEGGSADCDHVVGEMRRGLGLAASPANTRGGAKKVAETADIKAARECPKCGARRADAQLGMEATVEEYVENLVAVFRLVRDILTDDGVLWLNLGDTYAGKGGQSPQSGPLFKGRARQRENICVSARRSGDGIKPKDLMGVPWEVAFALRRDGWYLRQDIIWRKPNPMPESVKDRCTKSHEYIFLLSKSADYHYDHQAIKEPTVYGNSGRRSATPDQLNPNRKRNDRKVGASFRAITTLRNKRSVWDVATRPYKDAHFAVFPEKLVEPCILAGSRIGDVVLDPFMGSGTTAAVAIRHGRDYLGCELNPEFKALQDKRISAALAERQRYENRQRSLFDE